LKNGFYISILAILFGTKKYCAFDNTKKKHGPSDFRVLKLIRSASSSWG